MKQRSWLAALVVAWGLASLARAAPTVAMNGHLPSASDCASMAALGARAVRMDFNWFQFEPAQDAFTFGYLDGAVQAANDNGLAVYATVAYTPPWAGVLPTCTISSPDEAQRCENKEPVNVADWTDAVTHVVEHFKGKVECWGIWNEPNLRGFFDGSEDDFVNRIFLPAAAAIREADPGAKICGPELSGLADGSNWNGKKGTCILGACIRNGWEIDLAELLDRVGPQLDVVTHHTYQSDAPGVMRAVLDGSSIAGVLQHDAIRNVVRAHGGAGKEFWLTETGWEHGPQGSYTDAEVATRIVDLYAKQEEVCAGTYAASTNDPFAAWTRTYYFHFPYDPGSGWGLLDSSQAPLAPYTALQGWTAGRTTSACVGPSQPPDAGSPRTDAALAGPDAAPTGPDAAAAGADASTSGADARPPDAASTGVDAPPQSLDSSSQADAAARSDAGGIDGGASDAGGGTVIDASEGSSDVASGCGCQSAGAPGVALLGALALCRRRGQPRRP